MRLRAVQRALLFGADRHGAEMELMGCQPFDQEHNTRAERAELLRRDGELQPMAARAASGKGRA
jgi:hypothetical protein